MTHSANSRKNQAQSRRRTFPALCYGHIPLLKLWNEEPRLKDKIAQVKKRMDLVLESKLYKKFMPEMLKRDNKSELGGIFIKAMEEFDLAERQFFSTICFYAQASGALDNKVKPEIFAEMLGMVLKGVEVQILLSDDRSASLATYEEMVNFITNTDNYSI